MIPSRSVNQTFESSEFAVPTPSLPALAHCASCPGAPGARLFVCATTTPHSTQTKRTHRRDAFVARIRFIKLALSFASRLLRLSAPAAKHVEADGGDEHCALDDVLHP